MGRLCVWRRDRMWEDRVFGDGIGCGKNVFGDGIGCGKNVCLATG